MAAARIDEFTKIAPQARLAFELFRDCVSDLNRLNKQDAELAFAAYLRVRMAVAEEKRSARPQDIHAPESLTPDALISISEMFVRENPEGGRRAQAFVAAVLDCVFPSVRLQPVNNPRPGDVRVIDGNQTRLPVEVKQVPVTEQAGLDLARAARVLGARSALLVVIADKHAPLDREQVRRRALDQTGVFVEVCESVRELVGALAVFSGGNAESIVEELAVEVRGTSPRARGQRRRAATLARPRRGPSREVMRERGRLASTLSKGRRWPSRPRITRSYRSWPSGPWPCWWPPSPCPSPCGGGVAVPVMSPLLPSTEFTQVPFRPAWYCQPHQARS